MAPIRHGTTQPQEAEQPARPPAARRAPGARRRRGCSRMRPSSAMLVCRRRAPPDASSTNASSGWRRRRGRAGRRAATSSTTMFALLLFPFLRCCSAPVGAHHMLRLPVPALPLSSLPPSAAACGAGRTAALLLMTSSTSSSAAFVPHAAAASCRPTLAASEPGTVQLSPADIPHDPCAELQWAADGRLDRLLRHFCPAPQGMYSPPALGTSIRLFLIACRSRLANPATAMVARADAFA